MSSTFEPIRGSARIEFRDLARFSLGIALRRLALSTFCVLAILGFSFWRLFSGYGGALRSMDAAEQREMVTTLWESAALTAGIFAFFVVMSLLVWVVLFPAIALWRTGRDRRTLTWVIDETGIRRTDALGAESLLPWSNIQKVRRSRRMLWFKLRPNGWRYLLRRAFSPEDQDRLERLASKMVS
jgi:hypothetical protein